MCSYHPILPFHQMYIISLSTLTSLNLNSFDWFEIEGLRIQNDTEIHVYTCMNESNSCFSKASGEQSTREDDSVVHVNLPWCSWYIFNNVCRIKR